VRVPGAIDAAPECHRDRTALDGDPAGAAPFFAGLIGVFQGEIVTPSAIDPGRPDLDRGR